MQGAVASETERGRERFHAGSGSTALSASGVTKRFPGVLAVDNASFSIATGEIVALLGQNGAGKSTLIQILSGVHPRDTYEGVIRLGDRPYRPASVRDAESEGVAFVPQEVNVVPDLSVAENLFLNAEPSRWGFLDVSGRLAKARRALDDFGLSLDAGTTMGSLDLATQQLVIIARALSKRARLLILDEPTAALTEDEASRLFEKMRELARRGVAIIFVSHRLGEVFKISDRIVIMRDGRICGSHRTADVTRERVVADMIGGGRASTFHTEIQPGRAALKVRNLCVADPFDEERPRVLNVSLDLREGETVGLFGLIGAGCLEAALAIYGAWQGKVSVDLEIDGEPCVITTPAEAVARGLGLMAQDRRETLLLGHSVHDNIVLANLRAYSHRGVLDVGASRRDARDLVSRLDIKTASIDAEVGVLSGGNQQKVQAARWIAAGARILILIDPTRGVDVGARTEIKRVWRELSSSGHAILIASTDAEELVGLCDRVIVLRNGSMAGELTGSELSEESLLGLASNV
jgi:ABC-type sugar transport system ATPase subunit